MPKKKNIIQSKAIFRVANKMLIFLPLLIVLIVSLFYNPGWSFDWSNQFYPLVLQFLIFLGFGIIVIITIREKKRLSINMLDLAIVSYLLYSVIRTAISIGNHSYSADIFYPLAYCGFYLGMRTFISSHRFTQNIVNIVLSFGILNIIIAFLQSIDVLPLVSPSFKVNGTFFNPGPFAGYLATVAPFSFLAFGSLDRIPKYTFRFLLFTLFLTFVIISESRAGLVSMLISSTALLFFVSAKRMKFATRFISVTIGMALVLVFIYMLYHVRTPSADGRLLIWKITTEMIAEKPFLGRGLGSFNRQYSNYQAKYFCSGEASDNEKWLSGNVHSPFNEYLRILVELGLLGIVLFGAIMFIVFKKLWQIDNSQGYAILCSSLIAVLIFGFFSYPFQVSSINLYFFLVLSLLGGYFSNIYQFNGYRSIIIKYLTLLVFLGLAIQTVVTTVAVSKWKTANNIILYNPAFAIERYEEIRSILINKESFLYNYASQLVELGYYQEALKIYENIIVAQQDVYLYSQIGRCYESLGNFEEAERNYQAASCMLPFRLHPQLNLFKLYVSSGQFRKAEHQANSILNTPVKIQTQEAEMIKNEIQAYLLERKKISENTSQ